MTMDEWNEQNGTAKEAETAQWLDADDVVVEEPPKIKNAVVTENNDKPVEVANTSSKFGTISLVLGVFSILMGVFFAGAPMIGILLGAGAITLGALERKNGNPQTKGPATGGLVCGIVGVSLSIIFGIICSLISTAIGIVFRVFSWLFM
ncbi:MAG: hypothetical protein MJ107_02685 [Lachnospiraceae bacterium]|nr:hypothetical protein [Lachnospiraceae bacterium]